MKVKIDEQNRKLSLVHVFPRHHFTKLLKYMTLISMVWCFSLRVKRILSRPTLTFIWSKYIYFHMSRKPNEKLIFRFGLSWSCWNHWMFDWIFNLFFSQSYRVNFCSINSAYTVFHTPWNYTHQDRCSSEFWRYVVLRIFFPDCFFSNQVFICGLASLSQARLH
jgi:hypothetical protein